MEVLGSIGTIVPKETGTLIVVVVERSSGPEEDREDDWCLEEALGLPSDGLTVEHFEILFGFAPDKVVSLLPPCPEQDEWDNDLAAWTMDEIISWAADEGHQLILVGRRVCDAYSWPDSYEYGTRVSEPVVVNGFLASAEGMLLPDMDELLAEFPEMVGMLRKAVSAFLDD